MGFSFLVSFIGSCSHHYDQMHEQIPVKRGGTALGNGTSKPLSHGRKRMAVRERNGCMGSALPFSLQPLVIQPMPHHHPQ